MRRRLIRAAWAVELFALGYSIGKARGLWLGTDGRL